MLQQSCPGERRENEGKWFLKGFLSQVTPIGLANN